MPRRNLAQLYRYEFANYNAGRFRQDLLVGLTVAAVALPLGPWPLVWPRAPAPAAGLVTAILAGFSIFWSVDQAIVGAEALGCLHCQAEQAESSQETVAARVTLVP